jgi:hypothetical protein
MRSPRRTADHCAPIGGWLPRGCNAAITRAYGIAGGAGRLCEVHNRAMERLFGAAAAIATWAGWLAICPSLGFPALGTVGMVNRALYKVIPEAGHNPVFWLGWLILIAALVGAIAVFFTLEWRRLVRPSIGTGVIFGLILWLVVGLLVMPLLGVIDPTSPAPQQPPDAMRATVMMYTLGPLASVAALIAWTLFGAILGATGRSRSAPALVAGR